MTPLIALVLTILVVVILTYGLLYLFNLFFTPSEPPLVKAKSAINVIVWLLVLVWVIVRVVGALTGATVNVR